MDLSPFAQSMFPQQGTQPAQPQGTQPAQPQEAAQQPDVVEEEQGDLNGKEEGAENQNKVEVVEVEVKNKGQRVEQQAEDTVTGPSTANVESVLDLPEAGLFKTR